MENFLNNVESLLGINLTTAQQAAFSVYERELQDWNTRFNLTAIRNRDGIQTKHFLDSLSCMLVIKDNIPSSLVDVGSGAGFPGIPLKLLIPEMRMVLVESVGKKVEFCRHLVDKLNLRQVEILQSRAEEMGQSQKYREKFDCSVARAVADLPVLVEYLLPLTRVGGMMIAQKGQNGPAEVQKAEKAIQILGGKIRLVRKVNLPGVVEDRFLIVIDKVSPTHSQYPRRIGVPIKKPL